jgi:diadenosine tetraphosphate (Ap4A) HIT family hydrolase
MNDNCRICTANPEETAKAELLTSKFWRVSLAQDQGYLGRCFVTLRGHKGSLSELTDDEWQDYIHIVRRLEQACKVGLGASLSNWTCLMNHAYKERPAYPHVHWHFRPRYEKPAVINGVTFEDPDFGHHYDRRQERTVDGPTFQAIINAIKAHL